MSTYNFLISYAGNNKKKKKVFGRSISTYPNKRLSEGDILAFEAEVEAEDELTSVCALSFQRLRSEKEDGE